jgi:hypothetical protein
MSNKAAAAEAYSTNINQMVQRLKSERPTKGVEIGGDIIPFKNSDPYFMAAVMGFFVISEKQEPEEAFTHAINIFADQITGDAERKRACGDLFKSCMEWHMMCHLEDPESAEAFRLKCETYIRERIDYAGIDIPADHSPKVEESKKKTVREFLEEREQYLKDEKPILLIDLGSRSAPLKPSNFQFISMIMAFAIQHLNQLEADALHYSILTFVLIRDGTDQEKVDANMTADSAFRWSWDNSRKSFTENMVFQMYCAHKIKEHFGIAPRL